MVLLQFLIADLLAFHFPSWVNFFQKDSSTWIIIQFAYDKIFFAAKWSDVSYLYSQLWPE